jgi:hypothetical protein
VAVRRPALVSLALCLALVSAHAGRPAEPPAATALFAIGDFGVGGSAQRNLGAAMRRFEARSPVDLLVTLGDNDYTQSAIAFNSNWTASFGWAEGAGVVVAGALGNHDVRLERGRYQYDALGMPGPYYRRRAGDVELFVLDSNAVSTTQTLWLARALSTSTAVWKVAVVHHPPFTCGAYRSHPGVVRRWVPLFERHGVQLTLSGHDHNYQRFVPRRGVTYVVHGGGVGSYYPVKRCPRGYPRRVRARREHGWLYLTFTRERAVGWTVNVSGRRTDRFVVLP